MSSEAPSGRPAGTLRDGEMFWRDHYAWLKEKGYQLRSRYDPNWIPSWTTTGKLPQESEDSHALLSNRINDAIYLPTNSRVALKRVNVKNHPFEENITRLFSTKPLTEDPRNHCVPLLDVLYPQAVKETEVILIMPFLRAFDSPNFDTLGEAIACIRSLFEGVQFMHENRVAHRDIKPDNFMIESDKICPGGFHHMMDHLNPKLTGPAKFFTRTQRPSKYFIIDFGLSREYESGIEPPIEETMDGDEVRLQTPYQADVFHTGDLVREIFMDGHPILTHVRGYKGFEFLRPLINDMVQVDATKRPEMKEVVKRFNDLVSGLSTWKLRSRTSSRRANVFRDTVHMFSHWKRKIVYVAKGTPAIPEG